MFVLVCLVNRVKQAVGNELSLSCELSGRRHISLEEVDTKMPEQKYELEDLTYKKKEAPPVLDLRYVK